jgi:hypothetical protein
MQQRFLALGAAALLVMAVACGEGNKNPVSATDPAGAPSAGAAGADGSTLKATAPTAQSPSGRVDTGQPTLVVGAATGKFTTAAFTYRFQVLRGSTLVDEGTSPTTSWKVSKALEMDTSYTWKARAEYQGSYGPWSSTMTFSTPAFIEGYIRDQEIYDPLVNGKTVGEVHGPVEFIVGKGVKLLDHSSYISYRLSAPLEIGEFSIMITGVDEGSPGDKSKVMSMQEEGTSGTITDNDYRMTAELRGRSYATPGAITFRIITGDAGDDEYIHDGARHPASVGLSDELWYFWKFDWDLNGADLEVFEGSESGPNIYGEGVDGFPHAYRPDPHVVYLGAPPSRASSLDNTIPGMIVKNVWVSSRPRPVFPPFGGQ